MADNTHATLAPSASPRWFECPGSVREEAKYPEGESGPAAVDGTHTHTLLENCLTTRNNAYSYVGKNLADHEGEFYVDSDRAERVQFALDYIERRQQELGTVAIRAEEKTNPGVLIGVGCLYGTADVTIVSDGVLEIIDYKDGMTPVDPETPQLKIYGFGRLGEYVAPGDTSMPFDTVRLTIIQPKLRVMGQTGIQWIEMDTQELWDWGHGELKGKVETAMSPDAPLVPGDTQCKWCRAKGNCSALATKALEGAQVALETLDLAQQSADQDPNDLSDDKIREVIEAAPLIRQFLEGVEKEALKRFEAGKSIGGLKVVRGRGQRMWKEDEEKMAEVLGRMGLPKDMVFPKKLISPAQVVKAKWTKRNGEEKQLSARQLKRLEDEYIGKSAGGLKVVPEDAAGEPVVMSAAAIFADVKPVENSALPDWLK